MTPVANYRILQYNVLHHMQGWSWMKHLLEMPLAQRAQNVARAILDCSPDVVLPAEHHGEWAGVDAGTMDGSVVLVELLGDGYAITQDCVIYEGEPAVNRTPIIYNSKRFKCVDSGFIKLTEEAPFHSSNNKRMVTWAILEDVSEGEFRGTRLAVFNTHWSFAEYKGVSLEPIRKAQTKEMQDLINGERFQGIPKVIGGDLNTVYSDPLYGELLQNCGLSDADVTVNGKVSCNIVDHLAASGAEITSYVIHQADNASDHNPIYCDIQIKK